jgi:GNAT superfamily N-acetyltransferase
MVKTYLTPIQDFTIRFATKEDIPIIFHFIQSLAKYEKMADKVIATEEKLSKTLFENHQAEVLLAFEKDVPVGFALFYTSYSTFLASGNLFLEDLFIEEKFRHKGYGRLLITCLAVIAKERQYHRIDWWCLDWNLPSIGFYQRMGAKPLKEWLIFRLEGESIVNLANEMTN